MLGLLLSSVLWAGPLWGSDWQTASAPVGGVARFAGGSQGEVFAYVWREAGYYQSAVIDAGTGEVFGWGANAVARRADGAWEMIGGLTVAGDGAIDPASGFRYRSSEMPAFIPGSGVGVEGADSFWGWLGSQATGSAGGSAVFSPEASGGNWFVDPRMSEPVGGGPVRNAAGMAGRLKALVEAIVEKISPFIGPGIGLVLVFVVVWSWVEHVRRALGLKRLDAERARNGGLTDAEKKKALAGVEALEQKQLVRDYQREELARRGQAREQAEYLGHAKVDAWLGDDDFWHDPEGREKTRDVQAAGWFQTGFREELI